MGVYANYDYSNLIPADKSRGLQLSSFAFHDLQRLQLTRSSSALIDNFLGKEP